MVRFSFYVTTTLLKPSEYLNPSVHGYRKRKKVPEERALGGEKGQ